MTKLCPVCENLFETQRLEQKYCSEKCQESARNQRRKDYKYAWKREHTVPTFELPFCAFDGEGEADRFTLLADSTGRFIWNREGLSTIECLEFLLDSKPHYNNVWFSFGYDVNMMLRDVPLLGVKHSCEQLYREGYTTWKGYRIHYVPKKSLMIHHKQRSYVAYDVFGFFQSSFEKAIENWKLGVHEIISRGKAARGKFETWNKEDIIDYNAEECKLLVSLMDLYRQAHKKAGLPPLRRWDGAGAVAATWLEKYDVTGFFPHFEKLPKELDLASRMAYFGGRIEMAAWGHIGPEVHVLTQEESDAMMDEIQDGTYDGRYDIPIDALRIYHYDINSAYPYGLSICPDMSKLDWLLVPGSDLWDDFSLVHVQWDVRVSRYGWGPFPLREKSGTIVYPPKGEGWYWAVEVKAAMKRFLQGIAILESWVPQGDLSYPLRQIVLHDYKIRAELKSLGDWAHVALKLALNSLYGKTAQKKGFGGKAPRYRNLYWAGYITAVTRAKISEALLLAQDKVVETMTDGVYSLVSLDLPISHELGEWSFEEDDIVMDVVGAGVYRLIGKHRTIREEKERGFGNIEIPYEELLANWEKGRYEKKYIFTINRFIGMGAAIIGVKKYREHWRTFIEIQRTLKAVPVVGTSKRYGDALTAGYVEGRLHFQRPRYAKGSSENDLFGGFPISYPYAPAKIEAEHTEDEEFDLQYDRELEEL